MISHGLAASPMIEMPPMTASMPMVPARLKNFDATLHAGVHFFMT